MANLTPDEGLAVAGLLGTSGHELAHLWVKYGIEDVRVRDALRTAELLGWDETDMVGLWTIALQLCEAVARTDD